MLKLNHNVGARRRPCFIPRCGDLSFLRGRAKEVSGASVRVVQHFHLFEVLVCFQQSILTSTARAICVLG